MAEAQPPWRQRLDALSFSDEDKGILISLLLAMKHADREMAVDMNAQVATATLKRMLLSAAAVSQAGVDAGAGAAASGLVHPHRHGPQLAPPALSALLLGAFGERLRVRLRRVPQMLASRKRNPTVKSFQLPHGGLFVEPIGAYFKAQGLARPTLQLLHALLHMDKRFMQPDIEKWAESVQLLRLVAAPGMGKSTALDLLPEQLRQLVRDHEPTLVDVGADRLVARVKHSLKEDCMLVFSMDLSVKGLASLAHMEVGLEPRNVLAARMLFMATQVAGEEYDDFLVNLDACVALQCLDPLSVLRFIKAAAGLGPEDDGLVVFGFDEVNAVRKKEGGKKEGEEATWLQLALSEFVAARHAAAADGALRLMPVAITASTVASATTLKSTSSGKSASADLHLLPLSTSQMWAVLRDQVERLGHDAESSGVVVQGGRELQGEGQGAQPCPEHVARVLRFVGGNPRHLAWAISGMSGSTAPDMQGQLLRLDQGRTFHWLHNTTAFDLVTLLDRLSDLLTGWTSWLSASGSNNVLLTQVLVHGLLGRRVGRSASIPFTNQTWQDAENQGVCLLVNFGASAAAPTSSRTGSSGGWEVDDTRIDHWLRHHLREAVLYLPSANADSQPDQQVWLPPLLAIMSLKHMSCLPAPLAQPPLTARLADEWRDREFTDLMMLVLRLQLLAAEAAMAGGSRDSVLLCDLLPAELPAALNDTLVKLPGAGMQLAPKVVPTHLSDSDFLQLCTRASYDEGFAFVGPGNKGPDAWLVLQLTSGQQLVVNIQSKKRAVSQQTSLADVEEEAAKCWEVQLQQLMMIVTDNKTDNISGPYTHTKVPVVVVGKPTHERFYTQAGAYVKASIAARAYAELETKRQRTK